MIDSLLGVELPLPVKLIVAFVIVLALIALATWVFRRLGGDRVGGPAVARGRQPRLAVIDAASVDGRRRLVLVRRDNVEHLVMIGGPSDIVIEQNIVRAIPVAPPGPRPIAEPAMRAAPAEVAPPRVAADPYRERAPAPEARPRLEPMNRPARVERTERPEPPRAPIPQTDSPRARLAAAARRQEAEPRREPEMTAFDVHAPPTAADTSITDMASKLEAALRRAPPPRVEPDNGPVLQGPTPPMVPAAEPAGPPKPAPVAAPEPAAPPPAPAAAKEEKPASPPASANVPAPSSPKSMFDSLEEEMASLLGRPPGKP